MESQEGYGRWQGKGNDNRADDLSGDDGRPPGSKPGDEQRPGNTLKCPNCGKMFKNLGVHARFCTGKDIIIDNYMGKSLSSTIEAIEDVLKTVRYEIDINVSKGNGDFKSVELKIRIPIGR